MEESRFAADRHHQRTPETITGLQAEVAVEVRPEQEDKAHHDAQAPAEVHPECQKEEAGPDGEQAQQEDQQRGKHGYQSDRGAQ